MLALVITLLRWILGLARILEVQNATTQHPLKSQQIILIFTLQKPLNAQKNGCRGWGFKTEQQQGASLSQLESGHMGHGWNTRNAMGVDAIEKKALDPERLAWKAVFNCFLHRQKTAKISQTLKDKTPGGYAAGRVEKEDFSLSCCAGQKPKMLRHGTARLRKVWLEEHIQVAGPRGQQDKSTAHSSCKVKMFWDRNTSSSGPW